MNCWMYAGLRLSSREIAEVLDTMPVTFEAAENDPIFSGRSAYRTSWARSSARSM